MSDENNKQTPARWGGGYECPICKRVYADAMSSFCAKEVCEAGHPWNHLVWNSMQEMKEHHLRNTRV